MNWLHALILGAIQGCTEFFPISSSTHLKILKSALQIREESALFDLACHLGTAVCLVIYFRKDIREICFSHPKKMIPYSLALLPLIPAYFLFKPLKELVSDPFLLGPLLFVTAFLLFLTKGKLNGVSQSPSMKDALWIGSLQSLALIPGISRSASTIAAGLFRGLNIESAVRFSFLLSIPAIAGGVFLEAVKLFQTPIPLHNIGLCIVGFLTSWGVGFFVIQKAMPLLEKGVFKPFAWYCLILAILLSVGLVW